MGDRKGIAVVAAACAALAGLSYGCSGTVSQLFSAQGLSVGNITVVQFLLSALVLTVPVAVRHHDFPSAKETLKLLVVGLFQPGAAICYYSAISMLTVGQATAMQFQYVWMAVVIQCIVEKTAPKKVAVASSLLVVVGTIFGSGIVDELILGTSGGLSLAGLGFGTACALFYAIFLYFNGAVASETHPITRSFVISISGVIVSSLLYPSTYMDFMANPVAFVPCGIVMGCLTLIVPVMCLSFAARYLDGSKIALMTSLELPAAALSGFLVLGDSLSALVIAGIVVILAAVIISAKGGDVAEQENDAVQETV